MASVDIENMSVPHIFDSDDYNKRCASNNIDSVIANIIGNDQQKIEVNVLEIEREFFKDLEELGEEKNGGSVDNTVEPVSAANNTNRISSTSVAIHRNESNDDDDNSNNSKEENIIIENAIECVLEEDGEEQLREVGDSINHILNNLSENYPKEKYRKYLQTVEYSCENLFFWEGVELIKIMSQGHYKDQEIIDSKIKEKCKELYMKYVERGSECQINLSDRLRKKIQIEVEGANAEVNVWLAAQTEVVKLMSSDSFIRFKEWCDKQLQLQQQQQQQQYQQPTRSKSKRNSKTKNSNNESFSDTEAESKTIKKKRRMSLQHTFSLKSNSTSTIRGNSNVKGDISSQLSLSDDNILELRSNAGYNKNNMGNSTSANNDNCAIASNNSYSDDNNKFSGSILANSGISMIAVKKLSKKWSSSPKRASIG
eukprot:Pgem_evm1s9122